MRIKIMITNKKNKENKEDDDNGGDDDYEIQEDVTNQNIWNYQNL